MDDWRGNRYDELGPLDRAPSTDPPVIPRPLVEVALEPHPSSTLGPSDGHAIPAAYRNVKIDKEATKEERLLQMATGAPVKDIRKARARRDVPGDVDMVNHPSHYRNHPAKCACGRSIECIDVVEHMDYSRGNIIKYVWRAGLKGGPEKEVEDLRKAKFYIEREIARLEKAAQNT